MEFTANYKKLISAVRATERIISKNLSLPILNNILIKAKDNKITLSSTNLEIGINYWLGAKVIKEGEIAVPGKVLGDFLANLREEKISFSLKQQSLHIETENYKTKILTVNPKDFPIIPPNNGKLVFKIPSNQIKKALTFVFDSISLSETRPELNGAFINVREKEINIAATDGFRLAEKSIKNQNASERKLIVPRNTAAEIIRILEDREEEVLFNCSDNQVFISGADFELISRLIDGKYPDYKKVIPEKLITTVKVKKEDLERNIRLASIFSSSVSSDIKIESKNSLLSVSAKNTERGETEGTIKSELGKEDFEVSVNYNYLLEGLKNVSEDNVILGFSGQGSPLLLQGDGNKEANYIIMPLRR